ncbi:PrpF domain-containing protein [Symbioplanes lichenis]|uniref:PrpF domain-containing protein n=1 Tax=Symbioplanes lichenis TaxID=1629072 RepID=UPI00273A3BD6|nr:PrpF domain-containing protein [Actinoplanes lichenis]
MQMRGGTSKGAFFLAQDLPGDRDDVLVRIMGSPGEHQVDGIGGGHPLTSKVAVVAPGDHGVDYLFLQVVPDRPVVSAAQTCGNLLAGVGPFAIERGLVPVAGARTEVRIRLVNPHESWAVAKVPTPGGEVSYEDGIELTFPGGDREIFPTGRRVDRFAGVEVTCVDAGMPVVLVRAEDVGVAGTESPEQLEADDELRAIVEKIRLEAGPAMGLGDVRESTVPKVSLLSAPRHGGLVSTRTFIPHRVHAAIGVLGAVSVAAGVRTPGTVFPAGEGAGVEHPGGTATVSVELDETRMRSSSVVRTARKLADGLVWPRPATKGPAPC